MTEDTAADGRALGKHLTTTRLDCEPLTGAHAAALFAGLSDPTLYTYIPQDPPADLDALTARFQRLADEPYAPDRSELWLNWAMRERGSGAYIGTLEATVIPAEQTAYIAYFVFAPHQRRGYAREGVAALLGHLFDDHGVRVVNAEIDTRNRASIALVTALGFECVAHTPDADHFKGAPSDEYRYELRKDHR